MLMSRSRYSIHAMGIVKSMFAATRLLHGRQNVAGSNFYALRAIF